MPLNEADTRAKLIDPAIHSKGWTEDLISREETAGAIEVIDGKPRKRSTGRVDYVLRFKADSEAQPVAVALMEAKAENLPPTDGLEQVKFYAACNRFNVCFCFSSNGHMFVEYDRLTGLTTNPAPLSNFPTPGNLRRRYEEAMGFSLEDAAAKPLLSRYAGGEGGRRYYQDASIRAVLEKIARCEKEKKPRRALLSLATGAGKTFIAVNLLKRIADAGQLHRALFVCDRDELRSQGSAAFQNIFGSDAASVSAGKPQKNARVLIATYQTLDVDSENADANFLTQNYPENYFSHVIIDECHRSAWGKWSQVLLRNPEAVQIGLTATPRKLNLSSTQKEASEDAKITADNVKHFGEPVYEYDLGQGIEDGYLAACDIQKGRVNLDATGVDIEDILARHPIDSVTGRALDETQVREHYEKTSFERQILLPDRVVAMSADLFKYLLDSGGPEQKTIIFCATDRHADDVAAQMNNLYAQWSRERGQELLHPYAFKCTASVGGGDYLADLRGASRSHFIATTVDLLSTGVDVPVVRNIVFFKYVNSPISFYQMIGRGTRIDVEANKLMFTVYDYTNATRLFNQDFITRLKPSGQGRAEPRPKETTLQVEGFDVRVTEAGRYILALINGKTQPVTVEEYKAILAKNLTQEAPTLEAFRAHWSSPKERRDLLGHLPNSGRSAALIRGLEHMEAYDLYDVLGELGYGMAPKTRSDRVEAFGYKHKNWLSALPVETAATLRAVANQFVSGGTEGLESPSIFDTPEVRKSGGLAALKALGNPPDILREAKIRIFAA